MLDRVEAAFFDLDKTVIAKASMVAFGRPLYRAGMISRWLVLRALWGQLLFQTFGADEERMRKVRESALRVTRGWEQAKINAIVRDTLIDVIEPIVYDEALDLIRYHQSHGRRVFIISASPEEIVTPLARYLEVDEAIATRAMLDDDGRYTGEVEFYAYGPYKADAIREIAELEGIDLDESYAYSDSATDVPMLEMVGHPVAVNPDRELARVARQRDWEIRQFEHGVPLRERVALPPPGKAAAVGGAVVVTGAAAGVAWWLLSRRAAMPPPPSRQPLTDRARAAANRLAGSSVISSRLGASSPQPRRGRPRR
jgi:HAD superfamily hydrolase (TIGR01490 family)